MTSSGRPRLRRSLMVVACVGALFVSCTGQSVVDQALRASRGEGCAVVDVALEVQLCTYPSEFSRGGVTAHLVRFEQNQVLVVDYLNISGDPMNHNPDSLEAKFLAGAFVAVPIDGDVSEYLVKIY